jgi:hypothetical protein
LIVFGLMAILQVGLVVRDQIAVIHAAREAARAASVDRDEAVQCAARRVLARADVPGRARPSAGRSASRGFTTPAQICRWWKRCSPDPDLHAR